MSQMFPQCARDRHWRHQSPFMHATWGMHVLRLVPQRVHLVLEKKPESSFEPPNKRHGAKQTCMDVLLQVHQKMDKKGGTGRRGPTWSPVNRDFNRDPHCRLSPSWRAKLANMALFGAFSDKKEANSAEHVCFSGKNAKKHGFPVKSPPRGNVSSHMRPKHV